jgi:hypothetical protein
LIIGHYCAPFPNTVTLTLKLFLSGNDENLSLLSALNLILVFENPITYAVAFGSEVGEFVCAISEHTIAVNQYIEVNGIPKFKSTLKVLKRRILPTLIEYRAVLIKIPDGSLKEAVFNKSIGLLRLLVEFAELMFNLNGSVPSKPAPNFSRISKVQDDPELIVLTLSGTLSIAGSLKVDTDPTEIELSALGS